MIIIGDVKALERYSPFRDLFGSIPSCAKIELKNDVAGFNWTHIMSVFDY
jgi:hypothetical protein